MGATAQTTISTGQRGFPEIFLVEAIAQLAGIATIREEGEGGFLAAIDRAEFLGRPQPGDTLRIVARVVKAFGRLFLVEGEVTVAGTPLVRATMTLGVGKL